MFFFFKSSIFVQRIFLTLVVKILEPSSQESAWTVRYRSLLNYSPYLFANAVYYCTYFSMFGINCCEEVQFMLVLHWSVIIHVSVKPFGQHLAIFFLLRSLSVWYNCGVYQQKMYVCIYVYSYNTVTHNFFHSFMYVCKSGGIWV